jgi:hypothetical protein
MRVKNKDNKELMIKRLCNLSSSSLSTLFHALVDISDLNLVSFELSQINVMHGTPNNIPIVMVVLFIVITYVVQNQHHAN